MPCKNRLNPVYDSLSLIPIWVVVTNYPNNCNGENIKYEPKNINISRDIIENMKSQPELKDMAQEIENIYSSTLPKHEVKQLKAKL